MQRKKATEEKAAASAESSGASGKRQSSRTIVVSKAMRVVSSEARLAHPELICSHRYQSQHTLLNSFTCVLLQSYIAVWLAAVRIAFILSVENNL
jgi:hypothetical protein